MIRILGLDPGAVHVGIAEWEDSTCIAAYDVTPEDFTRAANGPWLGQFEVFVAEAYVPQGGFGDGKTGIDTVKLLGWYEWSVRLRFGTRVRLVTRLDRHSALRRLKAAGYNFAGAGHGGHARDAEAVTVAGMRWSVKDLDCSK